MLANKYEDDEIKYKMGVAHGTNMEKCIHNVDGKS